MTEHVERTTLLAYMDDDPSSDRHAIAVHLAACRMCRSELDSLYALSYLMRDTAIFDFLDQREHDRDRPVGGSDVAAAYKKMQTEEAQAEAFFAELMQLQIEKWLAAFEVRPKERTESMVQRLLREVETELNRRPAYALQMIDIAEGIAEELREPAPRRCAGDCWKHRANALRHLGRYPESLDAAEIAEAFYRSLTLGDYDAGQALYTKAVTLFKMTKYVEALQVLASASDILLEFGETVPLVKTIMLDAAIRFEQGEIERAQAAWREVVPMLEHFDDRVELARVRANLAECSLKLGLPDEALREALVAARDFANFGMDAERIRSEWTIAGIHLALGKYDTALDLFHGAAASFEALGMAADAGFVKLDITEELLRRHEWPKAALCAGELVDLFTTAGATAASVTALSYLRSAVEGERATPSLVQFVRSYVTTSSPSQDFMPPDLQVQ
jgi:tetratricopeptide (TPR) repeat protein